MHRIHKDMTCTHNHHWLITSRTAVYLFHPSFLHKLTQTFGFERQFVVALTHIFKCQLELLNLRFGMEYWMCQTNANI